MAFVSSQEASSSASRCAYHVFLSFRGEDTRTKFTDHLYTALIGAGFRTFRDNEGIERGENIKSELQKAIQQSRISLVVLSENFASSRWCLDELVLILECKRTLGRVVLPLFYGVDPSHVRKQIEGFAEAFKDHEDKYKVETDAKNGEWMGKLEGWRAALTEVAELGGMVLQNEAEGHESEFIQKVVKVVQDKLRRTALSVGPYLIGVEDSVRKINTWLHDGSTDVGILAIYGMGGIGKTTIAKCLYNLNFEKFDGSSFLANVREFSEQSNGLVLLQRQLLSDILRGRKEEIRNVDEGIIKIREALCSKKVLVVVDDVDQRDQLDAILGMQDWFYPGSKVILTTRNERLLKAHEVYKVHEVKKLQDDESLELFSWHAFGQNRPIDGFMDQSKRVVNYCGGLPLALQVLGSSLSVTSVDIWESAIQKLETIPDSQILKKLKISYDGLQDSHDKNLFLDIACFFVGEDKDYISSILDGCGVYTKVGLQNLIDRCLLTICQDNKVRMHQLLREMGREITRQESSQEPEKHSRLCHHKDCIKVLREKTGTETLEGLSLGFSSLSTRLFSSPIESLASSDYVDFETDAFSRMRKLRLLQLKSVRLSGDYKYLPRELRWLCWHGFSLKYIPDRFHLENLVCLDMQYSSLKQVWKRRKLLGLLKFLDLSYSPLLELTPDFSGLPSLERLSLRYCIKLVEIHESIGLLGRLRSLNLEGCENLQKLPANTGQLKSLQKLILSGCSKLDGVPFDLGKMEYLTIFYADGTSIYRPPPKNRGRKSSGSIFWPWILKQGRTPRLVTVKFSISSLCRSLGFLNLAQCDLTDDDLPKDLDCLSSLQSLDLSGNRICSLPKSIKNLTMLRHLWLKRCFWLQSLPLLPLSITMLAVNDCKSLEVVTNLPSRLVSLTLLAPYCEKLVEGLEAQGLFKLVPIGDIDAKVINHLGLVDVESMGKIEVLIFSNMSVTRRRVPLQGLCEFGIYSIYLPRTEVPARFSYISSASNSLGFIVPSLPNTRIIGFEICTIYSWFDGDFDDSRANSRYKDDFSIGISNNTKNLKWLYKPAFIGLPEDFCKDMAWLCHWKLENKLEVGDEVSILVFLPEYFQLKEVGVHFMYEQEEEEEPSCQRVSGGPDFSEYEICTGSYFLCNYHTGPYSPRKNYQRWSDDLILTAGSNDQKIFFKQ